MTPTPQSGAAAITSILNQHEALANHMARADLRPAATGEAAVLAAQQDAENALSMALHYLRANAANVPGAMRKAVQALAALNTLQAIAPAGAGARGQQVQGV